MTLFAISRMKNERDIVEPFCRHHCGMFDGLIVLDDGSTDGTYEVLQALRAEGLPLVLIREQAVGYEQGRYMTRLLRLAVRQHGADWVMPLDADEFVEPEPGRTLAQVLAGQTPQLLKLTWHGFAWRREDDNSVEQNPVVRLRWRMPPSPDALRKVLVPAAAVTDDAHLAQGNHELFRGSGEALPARSLESVQLCHFPVRSVAQYAGKIAIGYLQYAAMPGWNRRAGFHYHAPYRALIEGPDRFAEVMSADARRYSFEPDWPDLGDPVEAPFDYRGRPLAHGAPPAAPLGNVLKSAEAIAVKLAEAASQIEAAQHAILSTKGATPQERARIIAQEADSRVVVRDTRCRAPQPASHTFQSFWAGGALTPYAWLCLKSFIDHGHAFDLYAFETDIAVPTGVRVCDAREFFGADELFVYEDGFGKGSPAAFGNLFRCKLLAERGGWWVDTDVVCLARDIPSFSEFFAWEDAQLINNAVLYFEPGHPLTVKALAEAQRKGRAVRWGDTGPKLTTRLAKELGLAHRAFPSSVCYPVHYSEALDLLRPNRTESLRQRTAGALFVHLWNAMLDHRAVDRTMLPPKGSLLRRWADEHAAEGWRGEYDVEMLEAALRPDTEARVRLSADLALGFEDIARADALLHEMNSALRTHNIELRERNAELEARLEGAALREKHLQAERNAYAAMSEDRRAETDVMRNSTSWKLTGPLRRARDWLRNGRRGS